jgi:hypothetical protein
MRSNQEQEKEISPDTQPGGPSKGVSVTKKESGGDKTTVRSKGKENAHKCMDSFDNTNEVDDNVATDSMPK